MKVVQISFYVDPRRRSPTVLLEEWFSLTDVATAVAGTNNQVHVIQACSQEARIERGGVSFHFLEPEQRSGLLTDSRAFRDLVDNIAPDVFHVHGLIYPREVRKLRNLFGQSAILLQDHANRIPRIWRRPDFRRGLAAADGVAFCAMAQAVPYREAGLLHPDITVFEIPESTSTFTPGDKSLARARCGVFGEPAILSVGHLNTNKDPLTLLEGVSAATEEYPRLQLWCCFGTAPLLKAVQEKIAADQALRDRVHLVGRVPHDEVEQMMRAADIFVLASHHEGSSFSLIEALATGLEPVVTEIPSLLALTRNGSVGELWGRGDSQALAGALTKAIARIDSDSRARIVEHFNEFLSPAAVGRQLCTAYTNLIAKRHSRHAEATT